MANLIGLVTLDQIQLAEVDSDPTVNPGLAAPLGSVSFLGTNSSFGMWVHTASGNTAWNVIAPLSSGVSALTAGSIPFADSSGYLNQNNSKLFWDNTNFRLGVGTASPSYQFQVQSASGSVPNILATNSDFVNGSAGSGIYLSTGASSGATYGVIQAFKSGNTAAAPMVLNPFPANVGIGLTAPASLFHIDSGNATPTYHQFTAGTTTGQLVTNGTLFGIDGSGNAVWNQQLSGAYLNIQQAGVNYLRVDPSGVVIVGNNPKVDITGASVYPPFQIIGTTSVQMASIQYSNDTIAPVFNLLKSRGALNAQGILSASDELGRIQFRGSDGVNFQAGASIRALVDATPASGSMPGRLSFFTTPTSSTTPTEMFRMDSLGNAKAYNNLETRLHSFDVTTTATSASTLTLTAAAATSIQVFTGSTASQVVQLPSATTLLNGTLFKFVNNATVSVAVKDGSGTALVTIPNNSACDITLISNGTTAGTWVSQINFSLNAQEVTATAATTTTSATNNVLGAMSISPAIGGTYQVSFSTWVSHSTAGDTITFSIFANGSQKTDSVRTVIPFTGGVGTATQDIPVSLNGQVTVAAGQTIAIEWSTNGGTATATQRTMDIWRVG